MYVSRWQTEKKKTHVVSSHTSIHVATIYWQRIKNIGSPCASTAVIEIDCGLFYYVAAIKILSALPSYTQTIFSQSPGAINTKKTGLFKTAEAINDSKVIASNARKFSHICTRGVGEGSPRLDHLSSTPTAGPAQYGRRREWWKKGQKLLLTGERKKKQ